MEGVANSVEDKLIDSLSFKLAPGASYVQERKSVTFHPTGGNAYNANNGVKLMKFLLTGDGWLDPATFRIMFDLHNLEPTAAKELRPLGGPWTFFRRMRILVGGQVVEDIDSYNRCHEMFSILSSPDSRVNVQAEGFGLDWDIRKQVSTPYTATSFKGILGGQSQTVLFKPLSGLLNQSKMIPLRYAPITIELELVSNANDPIVSYLVDGPTFTTANTSLLWQIQNPQVKCDVCTLDNQLDNSYAEHLLSGKALPINYNTYVSQMQTISSQKVLLNVTRALSRLKSVFVTLNKAITAEETTVGRKNWNDFYSPMHTFASGEHNIFHESGEFEMQLQIGSKLYPEYPMRSHAEAYYQLRKTLGHASSNLHSFDITSHEYRDHKMIMAIDTERVLEAGFTGINTKSGDILNVRFNHNSADSLVLADQIHIILHSDCVMEIKDSGVSVWD
jgi:hypothetical protein